VASALTELHTRAEAAPTGAVVYVDNRPMSAFGWLPNTLRLPPGLAALFVIAFPSDTIEGRSMRFVEPDPSVRAPFFHRSGRTSQLLLPAPPSTS
jgi:hypothetical protein